MLLLIIPAVWLTVIVTYVAICMMAARGDRLAGADERGGELPEMKSISTLLGDLLVAREGPGRGERGARGVGRPPGAVTAPTGPGGGSWSDYLLAEGTDAPTARVAHR